VLFDGQFGILTGETPPPAEQFTSGAGPVVKFQLVPRRDCRQDRDAEVSSTVIFVSKGNNSVVMNNTFLLSSADI
jgi:hypothetical protein